MDSLQKSSKVYNLRCNRSISEKMLKEDFIYDIRRPLQIFDRKPALPEQRILKYECNLCHEQIATLLSLSTHVKFHCRKYCTKCFWIIMPNETIEHHMKKHQ